MPGIGGWGPRGDRGRRQNAASPSTTSIPFRPVVGETSPTESRSPRLNHRRAGALAPTPPVASRPPAACAFPSSAPLPPAPEFCGGLPIRPSPHRTRRGHHHFVERLFGPSIPSRAPPSGLLFRGDNFLGHELPLGSLSGIPRQDLCLANSLEVDYAIRRTSWHNPFR